LHAMPVHGPPSPLPGIPNPPSPFELPSPPVSKLLSRLGPPHAPASEPTKSVAAQVTPNVKDAECRFRCIGAEPPAAHKSRYQRLAQNEDHDLSNGR
jgi:hypothetical protein